MTERKAGAVLVRALKLVGSPHKLWRAIRWRVRNSILLAWIQIRHRNVVLGTGIRLSGTLRISGPGKVVIGDHCEFAGESGAANVLITCNPEATIVIGTACRFNGVHAVAQSSIRFGNHCLVADAHLCDTDFHATDPLLRLQGAVPNPQPIVIGDNVWIGSRAAILKGVTIGSNSVVGYRSVVRRNVPANCVVIGNPERVVKRLDVGTTESPNVQSQDADSGKPT